MENHLNAAHPFRKGNSTRIWLDLILKKNLKRCIDRSKINKNDCLDAMRESTMGATRSKALLKKALTGQINDRKVSMKGVDYSYRYAQDGSIPLGDELQWDKTAATIASRIRFRQFLKPGY